jgi:hypothetical protein
MSGVTRRCWDTCIDAPSTDAGDAATPAFNNDAGTLLQVDIAKKELVCLGKCMKKVKEFQDLSAMVLATENEKVRHLRLPLEAGLTMLRVCLLGAM